MARPLGDITPSAPSGSLRRDVGLFVGVTYVVSWACWAPLLSGVASQDTATRTLLTLLGGFGPAVGAVVALAVTGRPIRRWLRRLFVVRDRGRWYALALVIPPVVLLTAAVLHTLFRPVSFGLRTDVALLGYVLSVVSIAALGGGQEEFGWRGYLLPVLRQRYGPIAASLFVGGVWGLWHLPLFLVPGSEQSTLPVPLYIVVLVAVSVIMTWLFEASEHALPVVMLFHGGVNAIAYYPIRDPTAARSVVGYGLITALYLVVAVLIGVYLTRGRS